MMMMVIVYCRLVVMSYSHPLSMMTLLCYYVLLSIVFELTRIIHLTFICIAMTSHSIIIGILLFIQYIHKLNKQLIH